MPYNHVAENVLGTAGTICWTIQLIPQLWKSWRSKSTEGLSPWLVFSWGVSGAFLGVYAIVQNLNIPLIIQPQLFGLLSLVSWTQCMHYDKKWTPKRCVILLFTLCAVLGGFEAGMVFAVKPAWNKGNKGPVEAFGIISSVLISLSLLPQYYEIWKHKEVIGISVPFMLIDLLGGLFSDLSLVYRADFDVVAGVTYSIVVVMDGVVIIAACILNPIAAHRRKRERHAEPGHDHDMMNAAGTMDPESACRADSGQAGPRQSPSHTINPVAPEQGGDAVKVD
ncbi:hypothetical protein PLICRDRAFT_258314 [Plicaturopsis crispa FD-325 SS-3]|nr:hypothetical protein PLICRDRAFT_258314 [Plicaturopsis crispa FD-325 SS-3]